MATGGSGTRLHVASLPAACHLGLMGSPRSGRGQQQQQRQQHQQQEGQQEQLWQPHGSHSSRPCGVALPGSASSLGHARMEMKGKAPRGSPLEDSSKDAHSAPPNPGSQPHPACPPSHGAQMPLSSGIHSKHSGSLPNEDSPEFPEAAPAVSPPLTPQPQTLRRLPIYSSKMLQELRENPVLLETRPGHGCVSETFPPAQARPQSQSQPQPPPAQSEALKCLTLVHASGPQDECSQNSHGHSFGRSRSHQHLPGPPTVQHQASHGSSAVPGPSPCTSPAPASRAPPSVGAPGSSSSSLSTPSGLGVLEGAGGQNEGEKQDNGWSGPRSFGSWRKGSRSLGQCAWVDPNELHIDLHNSARQARRHQRRMELLHHSTTLGPEPRSQGDDAGVRGRRGRRRVATRSGEFLIEKPPREGGEEEEHASPSGKLMQRTDRSIRLQGILQDIAEARAPATTRNTEHGDSECFTVRA